MATFHEAMEVGFEVSRAEAVREIKLHGLDPAEFFEDEGDKDNYWSADVLGWLGY